MSKEIEKILANVRTEQALRVAQERLRQYADLLKPWADKQAEDMVRRVYEANERLWGRHAKRMGFDLKRYVTEGDLASIIEKMKWEASGYIRSLSNKAAESAAELAQDAMMYGLRPEAIEKEVLSLGKITENRARLIARTEVARANTILIQARAESIGSEAYIWQTAEDGRVRESHIEMNGKVVYWNNPPELDGFVAHAGSMPNCRCIPLPLLDGDELEEAIARKR